MSSLPIFSQTPPSTNPQQHPHIQLVVMLEKRKKMSLRSFFVQRALNFRSFFHYDMVKQASKCLFLLAIKIFLVLSIKLQARKLDGGFISVLDFVDWLDSFLWERGVFCYSLHLGVILAPLYSSLNHVSIMTQIQRVYLCNCERISPRRMSKTAINSLWTLQCYGNLEVVILIVNSMKNKYN